MYTNGDEIYDLLNLRYAFVILIEVGYKQYVQHLSIELGPLSKNINISGRINYLVSSYN